MKPTDDDFSFFEISQDNLDREWLRQPKIFFEASVKLADAKRDLEQRRTAFEIRSAELDAAIRNAPEEYKLVKATEGAIKACILTQPEYIEAKESVEDQKHKCDIFQAAVSALDHRKRALENLVDLFGMQYFSRPTTTANNSEAMEEKSKNRAFRPLKKNGRTKNDD